MGCRLRFGRDLRGTLRGVQRAKRLPHFVGQLLQDELDHEGSSRRCRCSVRPVTSKQLTRSLRDLGRCAALSDLCTQMPAAVFQRLLGISPSAAER
jgi:hypothetical protein